MPSRWLTSHLLYPNQDSSTVLLLLWCLYWFIWAVKTVCLYVKVKTYCSSAEDLVVKERMTMYEQTQGYLRVNLVTPNLAIDTKARAWYSSHRPTTIFGPDGWKLASRGQTVLWERQGHPQTCPTLCVWKLTTTHSLASSQTAGEDF